jgi:hypothetical protein
MRYCPYGDLSGRANVIVSGTPTGQTSLLISPFTKDEKLTQDHETSTAIACHLMHNGALAPDLLASSDYFSVDALTAIFAITDHEKFVDSEILQQIAATALYERSAEPDITRTVFVLNSWMDPVRSPLNAQMFRQERHELSNVLFEELIPRLPRIIQKVDYLERYWQDEERKLETTDDLLQSESVTLQEVENLDLAIFSIPLKEIEEEGRLFHPSLSWDTQLHPISLHSRTSCSRILLQAGQSKVFYFRPDSLTICNKGLVPERKNLQSLVDNLNAREPEAETRAGAEIWTCNPVQAPKSMMRTLPGLTSQVPEDDFQTALLEFLAAH